MSYPDHKSLANLTLRMHSNEQKSEKLQINFGRQGRKQNVQSEEYMVSKKNTSFRKFKKCKSNVYIFKTPTSGTQAALEDSLIILNNVSSVLTFKWNTQR